MSTKVQLSGGAFQDAAGNLLSDGYLLMELSQDGVVNSDEQVAAGIVLKILLDANGNVATSPAQYVWPNDVISPSGTFYTVSAYKADGQLVWGPNSQVVFSLPSPYDIGAWVPNQVSTADGNIVTYDIGVFLPGQSTASQVVLLLPLERAVRFAVNFSPSRAACGGNPSASTTFTICQNGTSIGTITFDTGGVATFASSGALFIAGDVLTVIAPTVVDATLANVGFLFSGTVVGD